MLEAFALSNPHATEAQAIRELHNLRSTKPSAMVVADEAASAVVPVVLQDEPEDKDRSGVAISLEATEWTKRMEKEYERLAERSVMRTATAEEERQLEKMRRSRRALKYPRTAEEIVSEYQRREATKALLAAMQFYARVHETPRPAWADAKENLHELHLP